MAATLLRDGLVTAWVDGHVLHDLRMHDQPLARRIAPVVRDADWGTVPLMPEAIEVAGGVLDARGTATRGEVSLDWHFRLSLHAEGRVQAACRLHARGPTQVDRAGLVLLLDAADTAGGKLTWTGPEHAGILTLEPSIAPQVLRDGRPTPIAGPFEHFSLELEDERNWTDGTYKAYAPPLGSGFPRRLGAGATVEQALTLRLGAAPRRRRHASAVPTLVLGEPSGRMPAIGTRVTSPAELSAAVRALHLSYARVELADTPAGDETQAAIATLGCRLEVGVEAGALLDPAGLAQRLTALQPARVVVGVASAAFTEAGEAARAIVAAAGLDCPVFVGPVSDSPRSTACGPTSPATASCSR